MRVRCKVFVFYANNLTFYSVLNMLYQSLITNSCERCKVFAFYAYLNTLLWNLAFKKSCVFALRILLGDRGHQGTGSIEDCMCIKYG